MANGWQSGLAVGAPVDQVLAEESARTFMNRVYRWMFVGLGLTSAVAFVTASTPEVMGFVRAAYLPLIIGELVLVFALSYLAPRVSGVTAALMFLAYAAVNGLTLSVIFLVYRLGSISSAFLVTAATFGAMSAYGTLTKRNLSAWGRFLFMGLAGLVIAGVVNLFIRSDGLSFVWSCASVVVFAGLTAYDTQKLRTFHASSGYSSAGSLAVTGALMLYLDFVNILLALLRLFGRRR